MFEDMELDVSDAELVHLDEEETELNTKEVELTEEQFMSVALGLRHRMTLAVAEAMQTIEIAGLAENQERALKQGVKRAMWACVKDVIHAQGAISGIDSETQRKATYND